MKKRVLGFKLINDCVGNPGFLTPNVVILPTCHQGL